MSSRKPRRAVLGLIAMSVPVTSGCVTSLRGSEPASSPDDCDSGATRIHTEPLTDEGHKEHADPIRVSQIPAEEKKILEQAFEDSQYFECGLGSDALQSLIDRIEDHKVVDGEEALFYAIDDDQWYELDVYRRDEHLTTE